MMTGFFAHQTAEKIARWAFFCIIALTAVVFGAFYLIGFNRPYTDDPDFNAPLLTDVLLIFVFLLVVAATVATVWCVVTAWRHRDTVKADNGVPAGRIAWTVAGATALLMAVTFLLGSTDPLMVNGNEYTDTFWLKTANMFVWSSAILILVAAAATVIYTLKNRNK